MIGNFIPFLLFLVQTALAADVGQLNFIAVGSKEIFDDRYYFRGDTRPPEVIFHDGFTIHKNKQAPTVTEPFGSGPEYLSFSKSFMAAAGFPILSTNDSPYLQLEEESYVYVISKKLHEIEEQAIVDFMAESIRDKLKNDLLKNYNFKDIKTNLPVLSGLHGTCFSLDVTGVAQVWGSILRHYWPKEMVIKNGKIPPPYIIGGFKVLRIRSPLSESSNLVQIKKFTPNASSVEFIDKNILNDPLINDSKWLLNLAMYNPVSFFEGTLQFYVNMLTSERDFKKERDAESVSMALHQVEDYWLKEFENGKGYNLLEKNPVGIQALLNWQ